MKQKLSNVEATFLIAGSGIGTGILTLPYAICQIGFGGAILALVTAYAASAIIYLMLGDLARNSKNSKELLGILKEHLFGGKYGKILSIVFFVILVIMIMQTLIVYILCAAEILHNLLNLPVPFLKVLFYVIASLVILSGIKGISKGEKISVWLIGMAIFILSVLSIFKPYGHLGFTFGKPSLVLAVYGLFMFAFSSIFSIIQVTNYIEDKKHLKSVILNGLRLNAFFTIVFAIISILGSKEVTTIATIGLAETIHIPFITYLCSIFVLLAMFTSYWSSGLAFSDIIELELHVSKRKAWIISTIPTILIATFVPFTILDFIQIGSGALSVIIVIIIVPAYRNAIQKEKNPLLGRFAKSKLLLGLIVFLILVMAISSFIPIS